MTIDIIPDEGLLEIFNFYLVEASERIEPWLPLVHVCRRWRSIVFASPRRLNVRVFYTPLRRVKVMLDIWPSLPIQILAYGYKASPWYGEKENLIAAFEHTDRTCQIRLLNFECSELEGILPAMQKPFPALTGLTIRGSHGIPMAVLPQAFLGGSAQHLRSCNFSAVEFPGIWKLLSTASNLVTLRLWPIPHSMYASPEEMAACLSTMPNLESLSVRFQSSQSPHNQSIRLLSPLTRVVLPSLTKFEFQVMREYIEDFVSRIDVPLLDHVGISFFDQPMFDVPRLHDFLTHMEKFKTHSRGAVAFYGHSIDFELKLKHGFLSFRIHCGELRRQVSSMAQLCGSSLPLPAALKRLDIHGGYSTLRLVRQVRVENTRWLDLLYPFTGLKDLYLGGRLRFHYADALQELAGERVTEVLPALQNLFIEGLEHLKPSGPTQEALAKFVAARQLSGLPVVVHSWDGQS